MTTESKARAAAIKQRREALGISFEGFYDQLGLTPRQGEFAESGRWGVNIIKHHDQAEKFLDHLEQKAGSAKKAPKPVSEHKPFNDKEASQKQLEKFADGLCQSLLKSGHNLVTIPWAEFYEVLYAATGCGRFNITLLESIFSNMTVCQLPFLISFGNNVVVICKDSLFAPVEIEDDGIDPDIKEPTTW